MSKINEKINEIQKYLDELMEAVPNTLEGYESNKIVRAACERYFEKVIEAVTDMAFIVITQKKFRIPEDDADSFKILEENGVIDNELYNHLKDAKGMRNFIAHQYGQINNKLVYEAITEELKKDVKKFVEQIEKTIK
ncbi:DUF86 domain-containing protein [Candidatus Woesearchaeota archaeon]|nr:DUF86 domain-containing protein [Candidatus Woesearchaeota archaeon]